MVSDQIGALGVGDLLGAYRSAQLSPEQVVATLLERAREASARLGAFTVLCEERATQEAREAADRWRAGSARPLEGVPFAVKDLFDTAGVATAYGSGHFDGHVPERDAAVVGALRAAGAILLGKTTTHEYAWGITTVGVHGTARNPWDPERIAGGSSGGSAVAVAVGAVPLAVGTDTAGSVRIPAAMCGVIGLKPTHGALSAEGAFPLAPSLDHVGLFARTPADVALALRLLAPFDGVEADAPGGLPAGAGTVAGEPAATLADAPGLPARVGTVAGEPDARLADAPGLPARVGTAAGEPDATLAPALQALAGADGVELRTVAWPDGDEALVTFGPLQRAEAARAHRERGLFPDRPDGYGPDVLGRLKAAQEVTLDDYVAATERREELRARCLEALTEVDLLVLPLVPCAPPRIEELAGPADDELRRTVLPCTVTQSLAGLPSCTVRTGWFPEGTPMAVQLVGRPYEDLAVLRAAQQLQELLDAAAGPDAGRALAPLGGEVLS